MKRTVAVMLCCMVFQAGIARADSTTAVFPDPSKPGTLYIPSGNGDVTVTGYSGREVIIESDQMDFTTQEETNSRARGLQRLAGNSTRVDTNKSDNSIEISRSFSTDEDITVQVPVNTSVYIGDGMINGNIEISGVTGTIGVKTMGGDITLENITSNVNANTMGGDIEIIIDRNIDTDKPLAVSTMGGDIDVTIPADLKANVKFSTMSGDMFTDFDIQRDTSGSVKEIEMKLDAERSTRDTGRMSEDIIRVTRTPRPIMFTGNPATTFYGVINGGGRFISLGTMGGNIYFRKK